MTTDELIDDAIRFVAEREANYKRMMVGIDLLHASHFAALADECRDINRYLTGLKSQMSVD